MLYIIGTGLSDEKDITVNGLEAVKKCYKVYLEDYTSKLNCSVERLESLYGKKIILADRNIVEKKAEQTFLAEAKEKDVALLVVGDPMSATTHIDIMLRAKKMGVKTKVIHNASILTAVGVVGLELYKYGKTGSIPFPDKSFTPETPYNVLRENKKAGLHTLLLLDLKPNEKKFMSVNDGIKYLLEIEKTRKENVFTEKTMCVGCARIGSEKQKIVYEEAGKLVKEDFGEPVHCIVIPASLHFVEEEALEQWK